MYFAYYKTCPLFFIIKIRKWTEQTRSITQVKYGLVRLVFIFIIIQNMIMMSMVLICWDYWSAKSFDVNYFK